MRNSFEDVINDELDMLYGFLRSAHQIFRDALFRPETTKDWIDLKYDISEQTRIDAAKEQTTHYLMQIRLLRRICRRVENHELLER